MRLTARMIETIITNARAVLGKDIKVWLFGSRVNDELRGGDIDLLIEVDASLENRVASACQIGAKIELALGAQRLDIIVKDCNTLNLPIHDAAKSQGIRLC